MTPPLLMLHFRPTLVSKLLIPHLPILYLLPLPPHHRPLLLNVLLRLLPPLPPNSVRVLQWNAGGLRARSTELLHLHSSHPVDLICIQESNLNSSSSFRIPGFSSLRSDRTHSRSGILFLLMPRMLAAALSFSSGRAYPFLNFLPPLFLRLIPTLIMQGSTSLLTTHPRFLFLMCTPPPLFAPPQRMAEPTSFLPSFFSPSEISSFLGTSIVITPSGTQEVLLTPAGRKYSTGSSPLTSSPSMTLTQPPFSIAPLAVAPLLTSPLLPLLFFLLTSPFSSSSPRPRLRHGRLLALLFYLNLTLNLCTLFFAISLALLPRLPPLLTSPTAFLPGNWLRSMPLT